MTLANLGEVVGYRLMGGGYAEDTALAATSRQAQKDCAEGLFDCPTPHTAILANDGNSTATGVGPGVLFRAKEPFRALPSDAATPAGSWVPGMFGSVDVPT